MRVALDLTSLHDHLTGLERYALNITRCLMEGFPADSYLLYFKGEIHPAFRALLARENAEAVVLRERNKLIFNQLALPRAMKRRPCDAYVFPAFPAPWTFGEPGTISAIHDISDFDCPEGKPWLKAQYCRMGITHAVRTSTAILTVSQFSKARIVEHFGLPAERVHVVHDGVAAEFSADIPQSAIEGMRAKFGLPERFLLCVSTLEPRKNLRALLAAYLELLEDDATQLDLVLVGRSGWNLRETLGDTRLPHDRVHLTGAVDDEDLRALYRAASAFVFPSKYEGFGLPPLEAMACGTCVLSSSAASMPEVLGDAALYFDCNSPQSMRQAITAFEALDEGTKEECHEKGRKRARLFDWSVESRKLHRLIEEVCRP